MNEPGFTEMPFPANREMIVDVMELSRRKHHVSGFVEIDVTLARTYIQRYRSMTGNRISFTGWVVKCLGQAVHEYPQIHAMRKGKRKLIIFDDVDILVTIEKQLKEEIIPLPYVVRKANEKSLLQVSDEIRAGQAADQIGKGMMIGQESLFLKLYQHSPGFIRRIIGRKLAKDPMYVKQSVGTVGVSSIGMMGKYNGWITPASPQPLYFALGSINRKPGVVQDEIKICEKLSVSFLFDHDVIDGAPVARFIDRLTSLMESAYGLDHLIPTNEV